MLMYLFSVIATCLVFGYAGYLLSKKYRRKINYTVLIPFIILSFILFYVGVGTRLISFFNFSIMLNQVLGSVVAGFTVGLFPKLKRRGAKS